MLEFDTLGRLSCFVVSVSCRSPVSPLVGPPLAISRLLLTLLKLGLPDNDKKQGVFWWHMFFHLLTSGLSSASAHQHSTSTSKTDLTDLNGSLFNASASLRSCNLACLRQKFSILVAHLTCILVSGNANAKNVQSYLHVCMFARMCLPKPE